MAQASHDLLHMQEQARNRRYSLHSMSRRERMVSFQHTSGTCSERIKRECMTFVPQLLAIEPSRCFLTFVIRCPIAARDVDGREVITTVIRLSTVSFIATIPARDEPHQQTVSVVIGIDVGDALVRLQEAARTKTRTKTSSRTSS